MFSREKEDGYAETVAMLGALSGNTVFMFVEDVSGKLGRNWDLRNMVINMVDHLADALNTIKTHEYVGQRRCTVKATKLIGEVLNLLKVHKYLKDFKKVDDGRGGYFEVELSGRINDCGVIKPRFPVKRNEWTKTEEQYIPGIGIGLLIVSTSQGIMTNTEAENKKIGGRLLAYVY